VIRRFPMLLLCLALAVASARADDLDRPDSDLPIALAAWQPVESDSLHFRVLLPPEHERVESIRNTWVGKVRELRLDAEVEGGEFSVQVRELPRAARWLVTRNFILDSAKDGFLEDGRRKQLVYEEITRNGYPGRHLRFEDPEREGWIEDAEIIIADDLLYFLVAARERASESSLPIRAFFDSFQIR
jgi:hypothetical protein